MREVQFAPATFEFQGWRHVSQNVAAEVLILDDVGKLLLHVGRVDLEGFLFHLGRFEGNFLEHFFQNRVQPARADIFGVLVYLGGKTSDGGDGVLGERKFEWFGIEQGDVLLDEGVLGLGEDADEIRFGKRS